MNADAVSAERIGAQWLRAAIAPVSDFGRRAEDAARPFGPGDEIRAHERCAAVVALARVLDPDGVAHIRAALRRAPDPVEIVSRAQLGDPLADVDFFELGRFADALEATARAWDAAGGAALQRPPLVPALAALLAPGREAGTFYLAEAFDPPLAAARARYAAADAGLQHERTRLAAGLSARVGVEPQSEEFILMRDLIPDLPAGVRVVRETPAYRLVALELDPPALAAAAQCELALDALGRAEDAVRRRLAADVATCGDALLGATRTLGELDRTLARVAFTARWGGCVPSVGAQRFRFVDASFVPLRAALADAGLPYTPISLGLDRLAVLTGPNMGGKSAALATCGFLTACLAYGVPPPAASAELPLTGSVVWIGGEQAADRVRLLSAFGGEVVRTRDALAGAVPPALFLVDEFARTTGPREGRALLVALVEELARRGAFALVATHFDGIALDARVPHLAIAGLRAGSLGRGPGGDVRAALDAVAQAMDFRVIAVSGAARSRSDALALAELLGLDPQIVQRAEGLFAQLPAGAASPVTE